MLKKYLFSTLIAVLLCSVGCGEADLNPCYDVNCIEGQYCLDGTCIDSQEPSLTFTNPPVPRSILITSMVVNRFPLVRSSGNSWDGGSLPGSAPDLQITITQSGSPQLWMNNPAYSNTDRVPVIINLATPIEISRVKTLVAFNFYDYDTPSMSAFMGGIFFTPYSRGNNYPTQVTLDNGLISIDLNLSYTFN